MTPLDPEMGENIPHPCKARALIGQDAAQRIFMDAYATHRLHHAWLICGPKGIGKATLAYRIAKFLLSQPADGGLFDTPSPALPPEALDHNLDPGVIARIEAGSEPGLFVLTRPRDEKTDKVKSVIPVDEVRRLKNFYTMSAGGNGRRVAIVDSVDDMNTPAANALLKTLEEPPNGSTLLLISHRPGDVLATIRSRTRTLTCRALPDDALAQIVQSVRPDMGFDPHLGALANGSAGRALDLLQSDALAIYGQILDILRDWPRFERAKMLAVADAFTGPRADPALFADLLDTALARIALAPFQSGVTLQAAAGEAELTRKLCPDPRAARIWADLQLNAARTLRRGLAVNLDPSSLILDSLLNIEKTTARLSQ